MARPKVSVIIPAYNRAHCVGVAIESVLRQTEPSFELLVVDDGSSDKTADVVRQFRDSRVELLQHKHNQGISAARNTGIIAARADTIALLDSDDLWFPKMLSSQLGLLKNAPKSVSAVVSDYVITDDQHTPRYVRHNSSSSRSPDDLIVIGHGIGMGQSLVTPRATFDKVGLFDTTYPRVEDWDWLLRFRQKSQLAINPQILFAYTESNYSKPDITRNCLRQLHHQHEPIIAARDGEKTHRKFEAAVDWKLARTEIAQRHWKPGTDLIVQSAAASATELVHYGARIIRDRLRVMLGPPQGFNRNDLSMGPKG
jgi:glycosyltransferase involved in cell wall biosynthesis